MGYQIEPNVVSDRAMSEVEAAYMAGLVDGEGSLYLVAQSSKARRSHHFVAEMTIGNTNLELLRWVVRTTGNGRISMSNRDMGPNHKQGYVWELSPRQIHHVLPQLLPHLIAKRRQAEILLRYFAIQRSGARSDGMPRTPEAAIPEVLALYAELRRLNQRGLKEPVVVEFSSAAPAVREKRLCAEGGCEARCYRGQSYCYQHWLERRDPVVKRCERCGSEMDCILPRKRFCSPKCQWQSAYERRKQNDAA